MKYFLSLLLIVVFILGCEDNEYPIEPQIGLKKLTFTQSDEDFEIITLTINLKDGDGDLGFDYNPARAEQYSRHWSDPYHYADLFLAENGTLTPVTTYLAYTSENTPRFFNPVLALNSSQTGKLVTAKTRNEPAYSDLPPNVFPEKCDHYRSMELYVTDNRVIDESYNVIDTLNEFVPPVYIVSETFYVEPNENYYNITVDYFVKQADGSFEKFDWTTIISGFCGTGFNARFPLIENGIGIIERQPFTIESKTTQESTLTYAMKSSAFSELFNGKTLKIQVRIKDRAFHESNLLETDEFTLESIRR